MTSQSLPFWFVSEWEFHEAVRRTREAIRLPYGQRDAALRGIAAEYGVSARTLRRWVGYKVTTVKCDKYHALFVIGAGRRPSQVTPWERAA